MLCSCGALLLLACLLLLLLACLLLLLLAEHAAYAAQREQQKNGVFEHIDIVFDVQIEKA
jgi:hypothetical protein